MSFLIGGGWVALATIAAEKFGSNVGGFIGGLPSTVVVSFFFIGLTQGAHHTFEATTVYPAAFAMNVISLIVYVVLAKKNLFLGIFGMILVWLMLQGVLVFIDLNRFPVSVLWWLIASSIAYYIMQKKMPIPSQNQIVVHYSMFQAAGRAFFGGTVVLLSVILSKIGGPIFGGIFSAFPSVFLSTLIIVSTTVSVDFSRALVKPLMISGTINCVVFVIAFRYIVLAFPLAIAMIFGYVISMGSALLTFQLIRTSRA